MKVTIGPYLNFWGPYQIAEKILFWIPKYDEKYHKNDTVYNFGKWLSEDRHGNDSYLTRFCQWVQDHRKRTVKIKVHNYDAWNAHNTMSLVMVEVFKELRRQKNSSGMIEDEDVPEQLRSTAPAANGAYVDEYVDGNMHVRYKWVLDEVIWALEQDNNDWEEQFIGDNRNDYDGMAVYQKRIDNGLRLMGKYWQTFWD